MKSIKVFIAILFLFFFYCRDGFGQNTSHPNVVFILVDDLGWADLGYSGSKLYESPHVDQLAREGIRFTNFYAGGPVCSPTRASILTGKATARTGITTFLITPEQDAEYVTHALPLSEYTVAEAFKDHGYATGFIGKWHLGYRQEHWAANQGFDFAIGGSTSKNDWKEAFPDQSPPVDRLETLMFSPYHFTHMPDGPENEYLTDRLTDETINFIKLNRDRPFFVFLSFHTVHTPLDAKPEVVQKYQEKLEKIGIPDSDEEEFGSRVYQNLAEYAAMVHHMDENVGRLMQALDDLKLRENTIVVFTSDNGGKNSVTSNAPLRGAKHNLYEGGIRVPTVIRFPGQIRPGSHSDVPLISDDFYPTLLEMADLPLQSDQHMDGKSFKSIAFKGVNRSPHEHLCWHYPHRRFEGAVRWKNYKLLYEYKTGRMELYDLVNDPGERNDLSENKPAVARKMRNKLRKWLHSTGAKFPAEPMIYP